MNFKSDLKHIKSYKSRISYIYFLKSNSIYYICSFFSAKIVVHLHPAPPNKEPGPFQSSKNSYIKLSFKEHGQIEVSFYMNKIVLERCVYVWCVCVCVLWLVNMMEGSIIQHTRFHHSFTIKFYYILSLSSERRVWSLGFSGNGKQRVWSQGRNRGWKIH